MQKWRRNIALIDANNFYCRCQQIFRPDLERDKKVIVVLSNNDGCVVARSAEAKTLGIKMGAPWFELKELASKHGIVAFSSNYALYADMSNRLMSILGTFSPIQEVYSIDECFLDLTGFTDIKERAYAMRAQVSKWTGLVVCVGVGPTKTLAKLANHVAKKHPKSKGVFNFNALSAAQESNVLSHLEVGDVWGIGRRQSVKLYAMGIETVLQLRDADPASMRAKFGVVMEKTIRELRGEECIGIEEVAPAKQQIVSSRSFGNPVVLIADLADAIAHFVTNAAGKLRAQNSIAGLLQVFIMTDRFREDRPQYNPTVAIPLPVATADTMKIAGYAMQGLQQIFKEGFQYKKAGVILGDIGPEHIIQTDLFAAQEDGCSASIMATMDEINAKYGRGTLKISNDGARNAWGMRADNKSPHYTTNWDEIATCK
ncbi:Y-family DNA polymerase [Herminiimonas aquatilis]|uniref:Y-family DNA polymerase n=1 Tax=Herminiimonas aquatilis TaxID=345342 RepID=A0ABW2J467_9BURK